MDPAWQLQLANQQILTMEAMLQSEREGQQQQMEALRSEFAQSKEEIANWSQVKLKLEEMAKESRLQTV